MLTDEQNSATLTEVAPESQPATAVGTPSDDGVYLHLTGKIALCAQADGTLQLFAYRTHDDPAPDGRIEVFPENGLLTFKQSGESQTVLVFSDVHLVVEVDVTKATATLDRLKIAAPDLQVVVEATGSSRFQTVMTSDPPPKPGTTKVATNRVA
jgi:hypothetical protein